MVPEGTRAVSAPDSMLLMSTQWLGERTAFHIRQGSCLCLKQVVSKACWKGQWGLAPRACCAMSLLSQDAASAQKWNASSIERDNERKGSKGIETQIISVQRRAWLALVWRWNHVQSAPAECCLKSCKQADFEEAWKHEHVEAETHLPVQFSMHLSETAQILYIASMHFS